MLRLWRTRVKGWWATLVNVVWGLGALRLQGLKKFGNKLCITRHRPLAIKLPKPCNVYQEEKDSYKDCARSSFGRAARHAGAPPAGAVVE
jgi:hypothetical protein